MVSEIFNILKQEHDEVKTLIKDIQKLGDESGELTRELSRRLHHHIKGEERYVYPEFEEFEELHEMIIEAQEEHDAAERVRSKLNWMTFTEVGFKARLKVLKEFVEHHMEEEENEIFPKAEKIVSKEQLEEIKENYNKYKERKIKF